MVKKLTLEPEDRDKARPSFEKIIIMMSQIENEQYYNINMVLILKNTATDLRWESWK